MCVFILLIPYLRPKPSIKFIHQLSYAFHQLPETKPLYTSSRSCQMHTVPSRDASCIWAPFMYRVASGRSRRTACYEALQWSNYPSVPDASDSGDAIPPLSERPREKHMVGLMSTVQQRTPHPRTVTERDRRLFLKEIWDEDEKLTEQ